MKTARGDVKKILIMVGEIQNLIGSAKGDIMNDRDAYAIDRAIPDMERAFELCLEITGMYERIQGKNERSRRAH